MSAIVNLDPTSKKHEICPRCSSPDTLLLSFQIPTTLGAQFNSKDALKKIGSDNSAHVNICKNCAFKWVLNDGVYTTSQISNFLIEDFVSVIKEAVDNEDSEILEDMLGVLFELGVCGKQTFSELPYSTNLSDKALYMISMFTDCIMESLSSTDDLVDFYNDYRVSMGYYDTPKASGASRPAAVESAAVRSASVDPGNRIAVEDVLTDD